MELKTAKPLLLLSSLLIALALSIPYLPQMEGGWAYLPVAAIAVALVQAVALLCLKPHPAPDHAAIEPEPAPVVQATRDEKTNAELVHLLALLQEQGRFVDFIMDDITPYGDAQVAAACRVVHQGCRDFVQKNFAIEPVAEPAEGDSLTLEAGYPAGDYRLTGSVGAEPPHTGTVVHRGWRASAVTMPRLTDAAVKDGRLPVIAPAELEL